MIAVNGIAMAPVIVGAGLAGLMTALRLAPLPVVVLAKAPAGTEASSGWAQGGVAAAIGADDSPALHLADTLAAGDGLCDADAARRITAAGPAAIAALLACGVRFDCDAAGVLARGLEAAHSRRRIVHAGGDGTGAEIMRALVTLARATPSITLLEATVRRLVVIDGAIAGVLAVTPAGVLRLPTRRVVIATGGLGGLFVHTTNPRGAFGQGLALAALAGAALADMEFVQFHPTGLDDGFRPMSLVSEAVRGEGATLIDETGARFMAGVPGRELASRDVVARAVWRHLGDGHRVFLDARAALGAGFALHFPAVATRCLAAGIDPARQPIPIRPAAHYHMGGIAVDASGRSTVAGLWACGEAASTGLHGANRLASNSLLEAVVCAGSVADDVAATPAGARPPRDRSAVPPEAVPDRVRAVVSPAAGVLRDHAGLAAAASALLPLTYAACADADPALVGVMLAVAALRRTESRGAHARIDFPTSDPAQAHRTTLTWAAARDAAAGFADARFADARFADARSA